MEKLILFCENDLNKSFKGVGEISFDGLKRECAELIYHQYRDKIEHLESSKNEAIYEAREMELTTFENITSLSEIENIFNEQLRMLYNQLIKEIEDCRPESDNMTKSKNIRLHYL